MTISTKLLILLLMIAVLPLGVVGLFDLVSARRLGEGLAEDRRQLLTRLAFEQMQELVEAYGRVLIRDQRVLEHAVTMQAREAGRLLGQSNPPQQPVLLASAWQTADSKQWPEGTALSPLHTRPNLDGTRTQIPVTYEHQVFYAVAGVAPELIEHDMGRLAAMTDTYRFARQLAPHQMYWQYTSLDSGFHSAYPGNGEYPEDYDPRVRPWYHKARDTGQVSWVLLPDVATREVSLTLSAPVYRLDGTFAGVTGIDVPLTSLFGELRLPPRWASQAEAMLVGPGEYVGLGAGHAVVLARQRTTPGGDRDWRKTPEPEVLVVDDPAQLARVLAAASEGHAGVERITVDGRSFLIAYGTGGVFPLVKVPELVLLADVEQARLRVLEETRHRQATMLVILLLMGLAVVGLALAASRKVTRPARELANAAHRLAEGDYDARAEVRGRDELAQLSEVFNQIGPQLRERERIKHSLTVAMEVQRNLLPSTTPSLQGLDIAGHSTYCDETGGDYYDYLDIVGLDGHGVAVVVGDVMGHGVAAAMLMATARGILRSRCTTPGSLADLLNHLNQLLVHDTGGKRFMTMMLMTIDSEHMALRFASAGHDPPFIYDPASDRFHELDHSGLPLGIVAEERYEEAMIDGLSPGTLLLTATDGVWEMKGRDGGMFGKDRVKQLLRAHHAKPAADIERELCEALSAYRGDGTPDDDVTFVVVKLT